MPQDLTGQQTEQGEDSPDPASITSQPLGPRPPLRRSEQDLRLVSSAAGSGSMSETTSIGDVREPLPRPGLNFEVSGATPKGDTTVQHMGERKGSKSRRPLGHGLAGEVAAEGATAGMAWSAELPLRQPFPPPGLPLPQPLQSSPSSVPIPSEERPRPTEDCLGILSRSVPDAPPGFAPMAAATNTAERTADALARGMQPLADQVTQPPPDGGDIASANAGVPPPLSACDGQIARPSASLVPVGGSVEDGVLEKVLEASKRTGMVASSITATDEERELEAALEASRQAQAIREQEERDAKAAIDVR